MDERFFRGRDTGLPIHDSAGREQGIIEVVAEWETGADEEVDEVVLALGTNSVAAHIWRNM